MDKKLSIGILILFICIFSSVKVNATSYALNTPYDYTTFTEADQYNFLTVNSATNLTVTLDPRYRIINLYKDIGVDYYSNFKFRTSIEATNLGGANYEAIICVTNTLGNYITLYATGISQSVYLRSDNSHLYLGVVNGASAQQYQISQSTWYYLEFERAGTTLTLKIYSSYDFQEANRLTTLTISSCATTKWRYLYGFDAWVSTLVSGQSSKIGELSYYNPVFSITITSNPTGYGYVSVNGSLITTPHTYSWNINTWHNISATSTVTIYANVEQHIYSSWSDSGTQSHIVISTADTSYTANFIKQYKHIITSTPITGTNIIKYNGNNQTSPYTSPWVSTGGSFTINAYLIPSTYKNYCFDVWDDSLARYHSVTPTTSHNYTATYQVCNYGVDLHVIGNNTIKYDGTIVSAPHTYHLIDNSIHYITSNYTAPEGSYLNVDGNATIKYEGGTVTTPHQYHLSDGNTYNLSANGTWVKGVDLSVDGNATITLDGSPVATPHNYHFNDGDSHNLTATGGLGGGNATVINLDAYPYTVVDGDNVSVLTHYILSSGTNHTVNILFDLIPEAAPTQITEYGWFYFAMLLLTLGLALIGYKIPFTAFISLILSLWLVINNAHYMDITLLYVILVLLSILLSILDLIKYGAGT